jgi:hypothetical protein
MRVLMLILIAVALCLAAAAPASASFTCKTGDTCSLSVTGSIRFENTKGGLTHFIQCSLSGTITFSDGDTSIAYSALTFNGCTNNVTCMAGVVSAQNISTWSFTLKSSTPIGTNQWSVGHTLGGFTTSNNNCGLISTGTLTFATQTPTCTGSINTGTTNITVACTGLSHTATQIWAVTSGASGTTFTLNSTVNYVPAGSITVSP